MLLLSPGAVVAQTTQDGQDMLDNHGDIGTGAVYSPQTPQQLAQTGTPLEIEGITPVVLAAGVDEPAQPASGELVLRGPVLHMEGDLVEIWLDSRPAVVRLPPGTLVGAIPAYSLLEAVGPPSDSGVLEARRVTLWLAPESGS